MATDEFGGVAVTDKSASDEFGGVPVQQETAPSPPISAGASSAGMPLVQQGPVGRLMTAFGQGFREASGPEPLGLSPESTKWLSKIGIFAPEGQNKFDNPFQAFNEGIIVPAAAALDGAIREVAGTYRGLQAAGIEAGLPADVVSLPDAFAGSPHLPGEISVRPGLSKDVRGRTVAGDSLMPEPLPEGTSLLPPSAFKEGDRGSSPFILNDGRVVSSGGDHVSVYNAMEQRDAGALRANFGPTHDEGFSVFVEAREGQAISQDQIDTIQRLLENKGARFGYMIRPADDWHAQPTSKGNNLDDFINETNKPNPIAESVAQAHDLGIIGPERPPISTAADLPKDRPLTMAAEGPRGEKVTAEVGSGDDAWWQRYNKFVGKLDTPQSIKDMLTDAAKDNDGFVQARQGDISLGQVEDIAQAAGVDASEINIRGLGRKLQNDLAVHRSMQWMLDSTERMQQAAQEVRTNDSPESLARLQEAVMRRDLAVEQVVGLRAEWGRTGNVIQEFMSKVKEENGLNDFLKGKGRSTDDLRAIADGLANLDPTQAGRFMNDLRTPTAWDKFKWYWVNALISGPITHAKYVVANAAFAGYESAVVTPVAGVVGTARRALTGGAEGVYMGEAAARTWGIVAGVPDALKAAVSAAKTNMQTPLPGELAQNIIPKRNKNIAYQQAPIGGPLGTVIGLPSRGASAIHSFFNFIGYRASIEGQAYRQAVKEGLTPAQEGFWQRRGALADRPTPEMMNDAIEEGYRLTYISELGETGRKLSSFVNSTKVGQLIMPFTHIPLNILKRSLEGTPAAFLDAETRDALAGKSGAAKQDMAIARMVVGGAVGAWAVNQVLNDRMTGFGPTDQKERAQWLATGHQPYSIRIGNEWISFNRFGSLGTMLGLYSNLAEVIPHIKPDAEELTKAIGLTVHSTGRLMEDEVGMQGLAGLMSAIDEPDRKGARFVANFAGSLLPYSSLLRQTASAMDPSMREAKSVVDGLRYYIPGVRQGLLPKRDWSGLPIPNAGYGGDIPGAPGASAILQHRNAVSDPVALELQALDIKPAPPQDLIKGVKLPPKLYDVYQSTAGPFTRTALENMINQPGWHDIPLSVRQDVVKRTIEATRSAAGAAVQMRYPQIIQQGVDDRLSRIRGVKPAKLKD